MLQNECLSQTKFESISTTGKASALLILLRARTIRFISQPRTSTILTHDAAKPILNEVRLSYLRRRETWTDCLMRL